MIHYDVDIALWMSALFFLGCPLGALARRLLDKKRAGA